MNACVFACLLMTKPTCHEKRASERTGFPKDALFLRLHLQKNVIDFKVIHHGIREAQCGVIVLTRVTIEFPCSPINSGWEHTALILFDERLG